MQNIMKLLLLCFVLAPAWAQTFQVIKAEYGADMNWTDVTSKVQSLVRGNGVEFTVDGQTLGDPLPGIQKTLRVRYIFRNRTQTQNFRDLQFVRLGNPGPGFGGGNGGGSGGNNPGFGQGLYVDSARYGVGNRWLDVTRTLQDSIRDNSIRLQVNNASFGSDPAPANEKVLEVSYRYRTQRHNVTIPENQFLDLPGGFGGGNGGGNAGLEILSARWGTGGRNVDVTNRVRNAVRDGRVEMRVDRYTMGSDPSNSGKNELQVEYMSRGRRETARVNQGGMLSLPGQGGGWQGGNGPIFGGGSNDPSALIVEQATWGYRNRTSDVTSDLSRMIQNNRLSVRADNGSFSSGDPAVGEDKELYVRYRVGNGQSREVRVREGRSVSIP